MKKSMILIGAAVLLLAAGHESFAQRRGGGGGGARGGGGGGGAVRGGSVGGAYGGAGGGARSGGTVVGPAGGTRSAGSTSGSHTTQRGTTIDYGAAGRSATGPGGATAGKGVGGVQVTTPGGKTATKAGTAKGVAGPGGNAAGTRTGVTTATGPGGSAAAAHRGGVAVGPYGAAGGKTTVARGSGGTTYASRSALAATGGTVRTNFWQFANQYPALTARWVGPTWRPITYGALASYAGYPAEEPVYWDYGENVVYSEDSVSISGTEVPAADFAQQATDLATAGKDAKAEPKKDDLQPLGVFAMVADGETKATNIFQLAMSKDGIIRGEYYNATTDITETVYGSVDKETQRAAWTVADRKTPVYEVGIANLTRAETTMLVHYSKEKSQQFTLVRIEQPEDGAAGDGKK